jgi:hypothetical protein
VYVVSSPYEVKWTETLIFVGSAYLHRCQNKAEIKPAGIQKCIAHAGCSNMDPSGRLQFKDYGMRSFIICTSPHIFFGLTS